VRMVFFESHQAKYEPPTVLCAMYVCMGCFVRYLIL